MAGTKTNTSYTTSVRLTPNNGIKVDFIWSNTIRTGSYSHTRNYYFFTLLIVMNQLRQCTISSRCRLQRHIKCPNMMIIWGQLMGRLILGLRIRLMQMGVRFAGLAFMSIMKYCINLLILARNRTNLPHCIPSILNTTNIHYTNASNNIIYLDSFWHRLKSILYWSIQFTTHNNYHQSLKYVCCILKTLKQFGRLKLNCLLVLMLIILRMGY